ncbi:MAG TPA: DUF349 domain-containing protein [Flavobacteriales bacterium]|nr:DUF349 domain-containing protein [Flavobacteriales bacterium]HMR27123.1 DUF349 domain-containing protein [Flavobacteriales bacterium]
MTTKAELIARMEALLQNEDLEHTAELVDAVKESYEALVAEAQHAATVVAGEPQAEGADAPAQPPIESAQLVDEDDKRFKQLVDAFHTKVNDVRRRKAKEEADNLAAKLAVMEELKALIHQEENIGNAFQRFKDLQEKWKTIGPVPQQAYRDLQRDFAHLLDDFFYHIRIYKELRDHDLKKNTALKQALIADMEAVQRVDSVKEAEALVKEYQEKWHQIGPVVKEEWETIRDRFWNATRVVYERIHEYYKARRTEHETNLAAKQALIDKVQTLVEQSAEVGVKDWKALTDQVLEAQNAWKSIGFATKKDNERIWKEFRTTCNAFFDRKKQYFDALKDQFKGARDKKQALLDQALALKDSTEWRQTAEKMKALQQQWKEAGSAGPRDEQKLWNRFREACDGFFAARKAHFDKLDGEQAEHLKAREALLAELEGFALTGDRNADLDALKAFSKRWLECGRVSPKHFDALQDRYRAALDKHYGQLKVEGEERRRAQFHDHVESLKSAPDGRDRIERETRFVKRKIEELENELRQFENRMGMFNFKSATGEAMRKEMEKQADRTRRDVERLREQHKQLVKELRQA